MRLSAGVRPTQHCLFPVQTLSGKGACACLSALPSPDFFLCLRTTLPSPLPPLHCTWPSPSWESSLEPLLMLQASSPPPFPLCLPLHPCISPMLLPSWQVPYVNHPHLSPLVSSDSLLSSSMKPALDFPLGGSPALLSPYYSPAPFPWPLSLLSADSGSGPYVHYMYAPEYRPHCMFSTCRNHSH